MNLPPQPQSTEEQEEQPTLHSSKEIPTQPSPAPDSLSQETEQPLAPLAPEHAPTQITSSPAMDTALASDDEDPTLHQDEVTTPESETPVLNTETPAPDEASTLDNGELATSDDEHSPADEEVFESDDEDFESGEMVPTSQSTGSGVFIPKGVLVAAACVVVLAALLAAFLVFINRSIDPPSDWISSYTPPANSTSTSGKIIYYLHWANQNGDLKGQLQLAANSTGTTQSVTAAAVGLYNKDNHIIFVVITINGQTDTLTGKINDKNDTLTLNLAGATTQNGQLIFHTGTANDYQQATKKLKPAAQPTPTPLPPTPTPAKK